MFYNVWQPHPSVKAMAYASNLFSLLGWIRYTLGFDILRFSTKKFNASAKNLVAKKARDYLWLQANHKVGNLMNQWYMICFFLLLVFYQWMLVQGQLVKELSILISLTIYHWFMWCRGFKASCCCVSLFLGYCKGFLYHDQVVLWSL